MVGLWGTAHRAAADISAVLRCKTGFCPLPSQVWLVEALQRCCPTEMHLWPRRLQSALLQDKQKARLAFHMLPGRIHTTDIFLLPFGNTPEMSIPQLHVSIKSNKQDKEQRTLTTLTTPINWRMCPSFEVNVQLTCYRDSTPSILKRIRPNPA